MKVVAVSLVLLTTACSEALIPPTATIPGRATNTVAAMRGGRPALIANSVRYRNSSQPVARGRSGSATLMVRALLTADGTKLELTTGDFDQPGAPGQIVGVQLKIFNAAGEATTRNLEGASGGYASYLIAGLHAGASYQVQARIRGIDGPRMAVVTTNDRVRRPPDVTVVSVSAPPSAAVGQPVQVAAALSEIGGDMGATANCVLYVNGVEVDRANDIWVDRASTVACAFMPVFNSAGTFTLEVRAEAVSPGDFDTSNNSASTQITVAGGGAEARLSGHLQVDLIEQYRIFARGRASEYPLVANISGFMPTRWYSVNLNSTSPPSFPVSVHVSISTDGQPMETFSGSVEDEGSPCAFGMSDAGLMLSVCPAFDHVGVSKYGSEVTYLSSEYGAIWDAPAGDFYYIRPPETRDEPNGYVDLGSTVTVDLRLTHNGETYVARPTVELAETIEETPPYYRCTFNFGLDWCDGGYERWRTKHGFMFF